MQFRYEFVDNRLRIQYLFELGGCEESLYAVEVQQLVNGSDPLLEVYLGVLQIVAIDLVELCQGGLVLLLGSVQNVPLLQDRIEDGFDVRLEIHHFVCDRSVLVMVA